MCQPPTVPDIDFTYSELSAAELHHSVTSYARLVMEEAYELDCYVTQGTSNGNRTSHQECAMRFLKERLGEGFYHIDTPPIRGTGHHAERRMKVWCGGM